jgi:hypothetical protein
VPANQVPEVEWGSGLPLHRATELLAPEVWAEYCNKSIPMFILEDPESARAFEEGKLAESQAQDALLDLVRSGRIELRTLHPRANPEGNWVRLSSDIVNALSAPDVDLEQSAIRASDGSTCMVRAFLPRHQVAEVAPNQQNIAVAGAEPPQKQPIKVRIADAFDRLTDADRTLLNQRGGVKMLEHILQRALPDVPLATLQRAFRRFRRERSLSPMRR